LGVWGLELQFTLFFALEEGFSKLNWKRLKAHFCLFYPEKPRENRAKSPKSYSKTPF